MVYVTLPVRNGVRMGSIQKINRAFQYDTFSLYYIYVHTPILPQKIIIHRHLTYTMNLLFLHAIMILWLLVRMNVIMIEMV